MNGIIKNTEPMGNNEDDIFIFVVHGFAPEFCDGFAFRTDKLCKPQRRKIIICPHCGRKFESVDANIKIEVFRYSRKSEETCHTFRHCKICHKVVGIKYA